jgi:dimethylargininase
LFRRAIVRAPAKNFADGLTTASLGKPDFELALAQHEAYCQALKACGVELVGLPPDLRHPDSTFVEDTAVLTDSCAILCRPGAPSRSSEVAGIEDAIRRFNPIVHQIEPPGTLDGGDVCEAGGHFLIGLSHRTNEAGARQLAHFLASEGYTSSTVDIRAMKSILHLKSGVAYLDNKVLVVAEEMARMQEFADFDLIPVSVDESYACNCVMVNARVLVPTGFPSVTAELERRGYGTLRLEMSEFRKMDGGLSCLSLRF